MEPTPANMQSFETVQSVLLWAQLKGDSYRRRLSFGCWSWWSSCSFGSYWDDAIAKLSALAKPATPAQKPKRWWPVGRQSWHLHTNVGEQFLVIPMCRVCRLRASLRRAAFQRPCIRHTRPSSTHPVVCAALFVLRQPQLLVVRHCLLQVAFHVLRWQACPQPHSFSSCRCVWDRGRLCIALWIGRRWLHEDVCLCDVDCVCWCLHISWLLLSFRWTAASVWRATAASGSCGGSLCLRGAGYTTGGRGWPPWGIKLHLCEVSSCVTS